MTNYKTEKIKRLEIVGLIIVILFIIVHAFIRQDNPIAVISAVCGITYTFLAGQGRPICYLYGVTGSSFYAFLSFQNALWGNLLLYLGYYLPMQILGYFRWNKNLKSGQKDIIKISLPKKELNILLLILAVLSVLVYFILLKYNDAHPVLDSITTVFSVGGMYLTVRRAIEQWVFWMGVNALSLAMWINVAFDGVKVYSTIIMWTVYLFLAIYFYIIWRKDIEG